MMTYIKKIREAGSKYQLSYYRGFPCKIFENFFKNSTGENFYENSHRKIGHLPYTETCYRLELG